MNVGLNLKKRIENHFYHKKWSALSKSGKSNITINRLLYPMDINESLGIENITLNITDKEVIKAFQYCDFVKYSLNGYPHTKLIEYISTIRLVDAVNNDVVLDAAGGANCEYLYFLQHCSNCKVTIIGQDAHKHSNENSNIKFISGSVDDVPLDNDTLSAITCHHSFEHFQNKIDIKFIKECLRILRPKGKLIITPLFIANSYAEIWNRIPSVVFDINARQIVDETGTFCGWGPYEGFARVYDELAFISRIVEPVRNIANFKVINIKYMSETYPNMEYIDYQPTVNANMKVLVVEKK